MAYFYNKQGLKTKKLSQSTINQIKQKYPKINFDFNQFKYGLPDSHPNFYSVRSLDPLRIKQTLERRKTPEYRERRKLESKKYYETNKPVILKKLKKQYRTPEGQKKYNIQLERRSKQVATELGFFPTGTKNPELNLWHDLYRASQAIKANPDPNRRFILEEKYLKNVPSNKETKRPSWSMNDYYKNVKFLDTKTGQRIKLNDKIKGEGTTLKNFLNNTIGKEENKKNVYENALKGYQFKNTLKNQKINYEGTDERLGTILQRLATQKQKTITGKNSLIFSALEVHHPYGVQNKFWNNEVAFRDANRELRVINSNLKREFDSVKDETEQKKVIGSFTKQVQKLPGGINYFFNDQNLGNVSPTSESILKAASKTYKDPIFTKAINKLVSSANFKSLVKGGALPSVAAAYLGYQALSPSTAEAKVPSPIQDTQTAMQDQVVEGQAPEPKLASPIKYDSYAGFVSPEDPNEKVSQSDLLYWIADNEIPEEVQEVGKMVGEAAAVIGGATVGLGLPDVKKTIEERKAIGKSPITGTLAKGFYRLGSPLATAAFTVPQILDEDTTFKDIGTDPLNYLGLATMETLGKRAGTVAAPAVAAEATGILGAAKRFATLKNVGEAVPGKLNAALRLGLSPRVIAGASRFLGIPGLIASTGYSLYDYLSNKESE
jgi:hypothetical protein